MPLLDDALTRLDRADDAGAVAVLERLATETPTHATVHVLLAQTCERLHRWDDALAAWQTARLFLPDLGLVHDGTLRATRVLAAMQTLRTPPRAAAPPPDPAPDSTPDPAPTSTAPPAETPPVVAPPAAATPPPRRPSSLFVDAFSAAPTALPWEPPPGVSPVVAPVVPLPEALDERLAAEERPVFVEDGPPDAAPVPDAARLPGIPSTFDLDDLIESLSGAGRIVPRDDVDAVPPPPGLDTDDADEVVSPTLARIFAAQGQIDEAIRAFERLAAADPSRAAEFRAEAAALRARTR